jgi:co-chaperonin GroES (HSP10)
MTPNNVLVRVDPVLNYSTTFQADTSVEPEKFVAVTGTVVQPPPRLLYFGSDIITMRNSKNMSRAELNLLRRMNDISVMYDVPMELKEGDRVLFRYQNMLTDDPEEEWRRVDEKHMIMQYDSIYATISDEDILNPLNGYIMVESTSHNTGRVVKKGAKVLGYLDTGAKDEFDVNPGDHIIFTKNSAVPIEWSTLRTLKVEYKRLHRRSIIGFLND